MILFIRTDSEDAHIGLYEETIVVERHWKAHRELSNNLLKAIEDLLSEASSDWDDLAGFVVFKGPGSFTGLRIGITVANTLANSLGAPIVGVNSDDWIEIGLKRLAHGENDTLVLPEYGGEANITKPRK